MSPTDNHRWIIGAFTVGEFMQLFDINYHTKPPTFLFNPPFLLDKSISP